MIAKTAAVRSSLGLVHGHTSPYLDSGRVQDTLHYPSPSVMQACTIQIARRSGSLKERCLLKEIAALCEKGAIARVLHSQLLHAAFYDSMFLVPKPNGTFRPILNISKLNVHIPCPHLKMSVHAAVRFQDWTCSINLQDVYLHVPINTAS